MKYTSIRLTLAAAMAALTVACATGGGSGYGYGGPSQGGYPQQQPQRCYDCGTIERITAVYNARQNSRTGAVLGGVVGAIAGRELADDKSEGRRNTATVAGAVAGAVAGNAIENQVNKESFDVVVRMDDGRYITINKTSLGTGFREGAYVRVNGNRITMLR